MENAELLDIVKKFGKIEGNEEDDLILSFIGAAKDTLERSGVKRDMECDLYKLAVERLTMHYYENREEVSNQNNTMPMGISWMIDHLRYGECI